MPRVQDAFSGYVFGACRTGDELDVTAPFGDFVFTEEVKRPALLIAFETGFAPVKSLIEHVTGGEGETPLHLYWITRASGRPPGTASGPYLDNLCRAWNDAFDNFRYTPVAVDGDDEAALEACARRIAGEHADLSASDAYVCAPSPLGDVVANRCIEHGLDPARLFREDLRG